MEQEQVLPPPPLPQVAHLLCSALSTMEGSCLARLATCLAPADMARVGGLVLADLTGLLAKVAGAVGEATDLTQCHTLEGGEGHLLHLQEVAGGSLGAQHYSYQLENRDGGEEGKAVIEVIDISDGLQAEGEGGVMAEVEGRGVREVQGVRYNFRSHIYPNSEKVLIGKLDLGKNSK